jgi:hypothetical protein
MLKDLKLVYPKIIISRCMENILKRGHFSSIAQCHVIQSFYDAFHLVHPNL